MFLKEIKLSFLASAAHGGGQNQRGRHILCLIVIRLDKLYDALGLLLPVWQIQNFPWNLEPLRIFRSAIPNKVVVDGILF